MTKNICELYGSNGYIRTAYTYTPYGEVTESANGVYQPIQWSSEYNDTEIGMVYYNYRHYNPMEGRWIGRDKEGEKKVYMLYDMVANAPIIYFDKLGKALRKANGRDFVEIPRYDVIKYDERGYRILGETLPLWPKLGGCSQCKLILQSENSIFLEVYYYSVTGIENWLDLKGNNVKQHEMQHVMSYIEYWNAFVSRANLYEKRYKSRNECLEKLLFLNKQLDKIIYAASLAQLEFDKEVYPRY